MPVCNKNIVRYILEKPPGELPGGFFYRFALSY